MSDFPRIFLIVLFCTVLQTNCVPLTDGVKPLPRQDLHIRVPRQAGEGIGDPPIIGSNTNLLLSNVMKKKDEIIPNKNTNYNAIKNVVNGKNVEQSLTTIDNQLQGNLGGIGGGFGFGGGGAAAAAAAAGGTGGPLGGGGAAAAAAAAGGAGGPLGGPGLDLAAGAGGGLGGAGAAAAAAVGGGDGAALALGVGAGGGLGGGLPPPNNALNTGPASNTGANANGVNGLTNANGGFGTNTGVGLNTVTVVNVDDKNLKNPYGDGINININPSVAVNEGGKLAKQSYEASSLIGLGVKAALAQNIQDVHEASLAHDIKKITHILEHDKPKYDALDHKKAHLIDAIEKETDKINAHHVNPHHVDPHHVDPHHVDPHQVDSKKPHYDDLKGKEHHLRDQIRQETDKIDAHHADPYYKDPHADEIVHKDYKLEEIKDDLHNRKPVYDPYYDGRYEEYDPYYYGGRDDYFNRRPDDDQTPQLKEIERLMKLLASLRHLDPYESQYKREVYPAYQPKVEEECDQ